MPTEQSRSVPFAVTLWTALTLLAALLWSRRLSGAFSGPMPMGWVMGWTGLVVSASALAWSRFPAKSQRPWPTVIAVVVAFLTSLAGSPGLEPTTLGVFLGVWCLSGVAILGWQTDAWNIAAIEWVVPTTATCDMRVGTTRPTKEPLLSVSSSPDNTPPDDALQQSMLRRLTDEGEIIEGVCRLVLAAGQREAAVHVSFCPPLTAAPQVELEDVDGHGWELKVAAAYPFGLRLVVRRGRDCSETVTGRIAYWAIAAGQSEAA